MIVSHAHQFIFFHNPKCAGTSLRGALARHHDDEVAFWGVFPATYFGNEVDYAHLRLWELQALFPRIVTAAETYRSVIFVRNPYQRFVSALAEHFQTFKLAGSLAVQSPEEQIRAVEMFIETLDIRLIRSDWRYVHFSPQLWFIRLGNRQIPRHVLAVGDTGAFMTRAFECLGLDAEDVGRHNVARLNLKHALTSPKVAGFVRQFYALDFDFFGADPTLAHLTAPPT